MPVRDDFRSRLAWLTLAGALLVVLWRGVPLVGDWFAPEQATPRMVTARGDLAADEKTTIELFEHARDSVVFITTKAQVRDFWTRNVFTVPRGAGSGFIWDAAGHVITNYHVIENASEASVKLADGRSYQALLVGVSPAHDIAVLRIGVGFRRPPAVPIGRSADLKVGQITTWRNNRLSEARLFAGVAFVARDVETFLADPASETARQKIMDWLTLLVPTNCSPPCSSANSYRKSWIG